MLGAFEVNIKVMLGIIVAVLIFIVVLALLKVLFTGGKLSDIAADMCGLIVSKFGPFAQMFGLSTVCEMLVRG